MIGKAPFPDGIYFGGSIPSTSELPGAKADIPAHHITEKIVFAVRIRRCFGQHITGERQNDAVSALLQHEDQLAAVHLVPQGAVDDFGHAGADSNANGFLEVFTGIGARLAGRTANLSVDGGDDKVRKLGGDLQKGIGQGILKGAGNLQGGIIDFFNLCSSRPGKAKQLRHYRLAPVKFMAACFNYSLSGGGC
jgi:hypothetical protein